MAQKLLKWTLDPETGILTCKHKASQTKEKFDLNLFWVNLVWADLEDVEKSGAAYCIQQKLSDLVAGKGAKAGYSAAETFALMRNKWDSLTIDRVWSMKSGERTSPQKKLSAMAVISESMVKAAPLLGLKIDPKAMILSDPIFAEYQKVDDKELFLAQLAKAKADEAKTN